MNFFILTSFVLALQAFVGVCLILSRNTPQSSNVRTLANASISLLLCNGIILSALCIALLAGTLSPVTLELPGIPQLSILIDTLSSSMGAFICFLGAVIFRYSVAYLEGEPNQLRFLGQLMLSIVSTQLLVLSGSMITLLVSWVLISLLLHALLTHYGTRPRGVLAARKKFLISRLGDICIVLAAILIWNEFGTVTFSVIFEKLHNSSMHSPQGTVSLTYFFSACLLTCAIMCKSAQVPFHSWLPDTLEAPTPVSALMHAGIINGGGFLLLRLQPFFAAVPSVLTAIALIGILTTALGLLIMWTQTNVKKRLAWSTVGQMGFMMLECGLCAYGLALMHMIGHGLYKAHAFLNSGSIALFHTSHESPSRIGAIIWKYTVGILLTVAAIIGCNALLGMEALHWNGGFFALCIVAIGIGSILTQRRMTTFQSMLLSCLVIVLSIPLLISVEHIGATILSQELVSAPPLEARGVYGTVAGVFIVLSFLCLALFPTGIVQQLKNRLVETYVAHAMNGFYFGIYADMFVRRIWPQQKKTQLTSTGWSDIYE
jgi:NAD(P)H-quinone oxidoreductase subunit 5